MNNPLISIVLPTYNGSTYIRKSIESCLSQSFTDFELIVVNDCSTDDTLRIVEEYAAKDQRIVLVNNAINKKLPLSLNAGFEVARGTYFTWTSDDNIYAKEALQALLDVLQSEKEIDLVYADYTLIDDAGKITGVRKFGDINVSFNRWLGCGACFLYKREVHLANKGYRPEAFLIEDYDFFVRAYTGNRFVYLARTDLYYYREHNASLTATQNAFINDVSKMFLEKNLAQLEVKLQREEIGLLYRKLAVYYAVQKNNAEKYKYYLAKLASGSKSETMKTVLYVLFQKCRHALVLGMTGIGYALTLLFVKKERS